MIFVLITVVLGAVVVGASLVRLMRSLKAVETETIRAAEELARLRQQVERGNGSTAPDQPF